MYTFQNDKVRLRAMTMSDVDDHLRWRYDADVTRTLLHFRPRSREEVASLVERWMEGGDNFAIEAIDLPQPVHIGNCSLHDIVWRSRKAEFAIAIGEKQYWGRGYATAATKLMLEYGFGELNLHRIYLYTFSFNNGAIRAYEKVGFKHEATLRDDVYREGKFHNTYLMGILKPEWETPVSHEP
jgi:RimJ/RimL family protein N-acetyltransferase